MHRSRQMFWVRIFSLQIREEKWKNVFLQICEEKIKHEKMFVLQICEEIKHAISKERVLPPRPQAWEHSLFFSGPRQDCWLWYHVFKIVNLGNSSFKIVFCSLISKFSFTINWLILFPRPCQRDQKFPTIHWLCQHKVAQNIIEPEVLWCYQKYLPSWIQYFLQMVSCPWGASSFYHLLFPDRC